MLAMKAIPISLLMTLFSTSCIAQEPTQNIAEGPLSVTLIHDGPDTRHSSRQTSTFACENFVTEIEFGYVNGGADIISRITINETDFQAEELADINSNFSKPLEDLIGLMLVNCPNQAEESGLHLWAYTTRPEKGAKLIERYLIRVTDSDFQFLGDHQYTQATKRTSE